MYLLNGQPVNCIAIADRGLQYGDGLFETLKVVDGRPICIDRHLNRLEFGCRKLLIPPPDKTLLIAEALKLSAGYEKAILKLIVTRGIGGRGYRQPPQISPTRLLSIHPFPDYPPDYWNKGIKVRFCDYRMAVNPALAGIKHLNRLEQILARAEWQDESIQEGLVLDSQNHIIEGTMSNLFLVKNKQLFTPDLTGCGVAGIVREMVIEFSSLNNIPLFEIQLDKETLLQADEIFITNSVIGIWPVIQLENQHFAYGEYTRLLQKCLVRSEK